MGSLFFCLLHPEIENENLDSIEHHCKYKEPERHKEELIKKFQTSCSNHGRRSSRMNHKVKNTQ